MAIQIEFKVVSETSKRAFEETMDIMCNKRDYIPMSPMTTSSVIAFDKKEGVNEIITTYSILLKKSV